MAVLFILGIAILLAVILGARWYVSTSPASLAKGLKWLVFGGLIALLLGLLLSGRLWAAVAALPAVLVWVMRMFSGLRMARMFGGFFTGGAAGRGSPGAAGWTTPGGQNGQNQASEVRTRFVEMNLDHASGEVSGRVLDGRFSGRTLASLNLKDLLELYQESQADPDSARVMEGYLDRREPNWRAQNSQDRAHGHDAGGGGRSAVMDRAEALKILGLKAGASAADIKSAHRRLMTNLHPDKGGSDYLAQQINRAKDVLLAG